MLSWILTMHPPPKKKKKKKKKWNVCNHFACVMLALHELCYLINQLLPIQNVPLLAKTKDGYKEERP